MSPLPTPRRAAPRILLVDDDSALLEGLAEMLRIRLESVHVDLCHGPAVAVRMVQHGQYDVILCDVSMPNVSGLELLPRFREADGAASILMMSATLDDSISKRALANGAIGIVGKPFDREGLTMMLKQTLKHRSVSESYRHSGTAV